MIENGADVNCGMYQACEGGHIDIINILIENGANIDYEIFQVACKNGNLDIVNMMIKKGADGWDYGLYGACQGGNLDIVNMMIKKGASYLDIGLRGACEGGHLEIMTYMIEKGAKNWKYGLQGACEGGHADIVKLIIEKEKIKWRQYPLDPIIISVDESKGIIFSRVPFKIPKDDDIIKVIYISLYDYLPDEMINEVLKYSIVEDFSLREWLQT